MKAIIVGAGIAGLTAAIAMQRRGIEFELYERAPGLTEVGAGISLWANALRVLDRLNIAAIHRISQVLVRTELRLSRGERQTSVFAAAELEKRLDYTPALVMVHRAELVDMLVEHLPSDLLHFGRELVNIDDDGPQVVAEFRDGSRVEADVLIAADGIKSIARDLLQGPAAPRYSGYTCFRGVSPRPSQVEPGYMGEWWGRGRRFGITTLPQDRIYWFATHNAPQGQRYDELPRTVRQLFSNWLDPVPQILESTPDHAFLHNDIIDRPPNPLQSRGRVVLIGDAAHATTPNLGQGGCLAIEDGYELAEALAALGGVDQIPEALKRFAVQRYPRTSSVVKQSQRLGAVGQWQSPWSCALRDRLVSLLARTSGPRELIKFAHYEPKPYDGLSVRHTDTDGPEVRGTVARTR